MNLDKESHFNQLAYNCSKIAQEKFSYLDEPNLTLSRRLVQVLINKNNNQILASFRHHADSEISEKIVLSELLKFKIFEIFKNYVQFYILWMLSSIYFLCSLLKDKKSLQKIIIIDSPIQTYSDPMDFYNVITNQIKPQNGFHDFLMIARGNHKTSVHEKFILHPKPILAAIQRVNVTLSDLFFFYQEQIAMLLLFFKLTFREPRVSLLYRDFLALSFIKLLDRKELLLYFFKTNSEFTDQQFWLESEEKNYRFATLYYSLNTLSFKYKNQNKTEFYRYRISYIEEAYTWSKTHQIWIEELRGKKVFITKPLLFHKEKKLHNLNFRYVIIFDVTPSNPSALQNIFYDFQNCYYTESRCLTFTRDVIEQILSADPSCKIVIKMKRKIRKPGVEAYYNFIEAQEREGKIIVVDPELSTEDLIEKSQLVISYPYTSTNSVAAALNKPSIYYDPCDQLDPEGLFDTDLIDFAQTPKQLNEKIRKYL